MARNERATQATSPYLNKPLRELAEVENRRKTMTDDNGNHAATPGDWEHGRFGRGGGRISLPANIEYSELTPIGEFAILAFIFRPKENKAEGEANARLLASAPKLLLALELAEMIITQHNLNSTASREERSATIERQIDWWNMVAMPAIAKAKGD